jgi:hypothetical protein
MDKYNIVTRQVGINFLIDKSEYNDLIEYCDLNKFDVNDIIKKSFKKGFSIEKYGLLNQNSTEEIKYIDVIKEIEVIKEVPVEKEVIKYIEIEKPIEVIKEVEVVKEVQVVKEIPVEVIKYITDDKKTNELILELEQIKTEKLNLQETVNSFKTNNNDRNEFKVQALQNTVQVLKQENIEKDKLIKELQKERLEIEKFNQEQKAGFLRSSNLDDKLYK